MNHRRKKTPSRSWRGIGRRAGEVHAHDRRREHHARRSRARPGRRGRASRNRRPASSASSAPCERAHPTRTGTKTEVRMPPSTSSYTMFGVVFAALYASESGGLTPSAASVTTTRIARSRATGACRRTSPPRRARWLRVPVSGVGASAVGPTSSRTAASSPTAAASVTSSAMPFTAVVRTTIVWSLIAAPEGESTTT